MRMKDEKKATIAVPEDVDSNEEAENENANGDVCEEFLTALDEQINELQVSWRSRFDRTRGERFDSLSQMSADFVFCYSLLYLDNLSLLTFTLHNY